MPTAPAATTVAAVPAVSGPAAVPGYTPGSTAAIPGVSAVGEMLSAAGTAVTPSALSAPTTAPAGGGAAVGAATTSAPAATPQTYPSLLD